MGPVGAHPTNHSDLIHVPQPDRQWDGADPLLAYAREWLYR